MIRLIKYAVSASAMATLIFAAFSCKVAEPEAEPSSATAVELGSSVMDNLSNATKAALAGHHALTTGTAVRVVAGGTWVGHMPDSIIIKTGVGIAAAGVDNINAISFGVGQKIYWDDFGVADDGNTYGRNLGLEIYAVAANGKTTAPEVSDWSHFEWSVDKTGTDIKKGDLVYANNISGSSRYKFDERSVSGKNLLDMKHAMSQVTFNITAGEGFNGSVGQTTHKFAAVPVVTMTSNRTGESNDEYSFTSGHVNVIAGQIHPYPGSRDKVKAQVISTSSTTITVIEQALVFPGSYLGRLNDTDIVAKIIADGNTYYLKAAKMRAAMLADDPSTNYSTKPGYNYIFNVTIKKTGVELTASIEDWKEVASAQETLKVVYPNDIVIVEGTSGTPVTVDKASFYLYRSTDKTAMGYVATKTAYNATESQWNNTPYIFWEDGVTSQYFRALAKYDKDTVLVADSNKTVIQKWTDDILWGTTSAHTGKEEDGTAHTYTEGQAINPRTGEVPMVFYHAGVKLTVNLSTSSEALKALDLTGAKVSITNLYKSADINVGDGTYSYTGYTRDADAIKNLGSANYPISGVDTLAGYKVVPQSLPDSSKIKVTLTDGSSYSLKFNTCKVQGKTTTISAWTKGNHYIYDIYLEKDSVEFSALIKDWVENNGSGTADLDWD